MQRSRQRKLKSGKSRPAAPETTSQRIERHGVSLLRHAPIAAAIMAALPRAYAQTAATGADETSGLQQVIVTAQKREENIQNVPVSVTALGTQTLEDLRITDFTDYVKYLPSVAFQASTAGGGSSGPGYYRVFMRGVAAGDNGNHSGPLPSVGVYLDEQPITTIQGAVDVHIYDIERVEALAGPQGTLYGASSEAGTVRIITNKPDPKAFKAGYDLTGTTVRGEGGYTVEGFVNMPVASNAAVRLVGWSERDPGYIDNVPNHLTYPTSGVCIANTSPPPAGCNSTPTHASNRFNPVDTYGARAALKVDLNDNWTITPSFMAQRMDSHGIFAFDPSIGDLEVSRYYGDSVQDKWWQAALTIQGRISNFDVTYAGSFLKRDDRTSSDYTDYSFFYDQQLGYGSYFVNDAGQPIDPSQYILGKDGYRLQSHELRVATPQNYPLRFIGGLFYQKQLHYIEQNYRIDQLPTDLSVTSWPQTLWLTEQRRQDLDYAVFGELSYDILPKLTATIGERLFWYDNGIEGFFGFGANNVYGSSTGENSCFEAATVAGAPCNNLHRSVSDHGNTPKFNLSYKFSDDAMIYATYSRGFRPGGINRRTQPAPLPPLATYAPDFLKNYEIGWKTSWFDNRVRFNGAFFWEDWDDFQFSFLGVNSFTIVRNAGAARIKGVEGSIDWLPMRGLTINAGATFLDAKLTQDFCLGNDPTTGAFLPLSECPLQYAVPSGTRLPVTPRFKGNLTARYSFPLVGDAVGHVQGALTYQSDSNPALAPAWNDLLGVQPSYAIADFMAGFESHGISLELFVQNAFDRRAQLSRYAECPVYSPYQIGTPTQLGTPICGIHPYVGVNTPRTIGLRFGQKF
jgi:outer membrane receptor protein involved in Fe transport